MMEQVDILLPPSFEKSGVVKPRSEAIAAGDWIGTFNLWIIQTQPQPAIVYQLRSPRSTWAPSKLDVTAGGHYQAGETIYNGLREVNEELGLTYTPEQLSYLGRKLHVSPDVYGYTRHNVVDIFFTLDNSPLETYRLEKDEVFAVITCPIEQLLEAHIKGHSFTASGLTNTREKIKITVTKESFPYNWDNYHYKITLLAQRFLNKENNLIY